jgi:DNA polymerase alpha subunit B
LLKLHLDKWFYFLVLNDIIEEMAEHLQNAHNVEEYSHVALPSQEEVTVAGRVCCDSNGKLNAKSLVLEGSIDMSSGKTIPVDLSQLKEYALFPGQIVAMAGHNSTGQKFVASKLFEVNVFMCGLKTTQGFQ